jgi:glyoxylase-like metal-dependent hydrolase (beta-lactamase superfamily II)
MRPLSKELAMSKRILIALLVLSGIGWYLTGPRAGDSAGGTYATGASERPLAGTVVAGQAPISLAIVRTSSRPVPEALVLSGGSFSRQVDVAFSGFVVRRGEQAFAFDLGLGSAIDAQYHADMPYWARPAFNYAKPVDTLKAQLSRHGGPAITEVILSHTHWDHASGLEDFPRALVWIAGEELDLMRHGARGAGGPWPSQVDRAGIRWQELRLDGGPFLGFSRSLDLFGDGSVVVVPLPGHSPGSIGLFVKVGSGRRFLLAGDAVWNAAAVSEGREKFWGARMIVDGDRAGTAQTVDQLRRLAREHPEIVIVPAHDGDAQAKLGFYPRWIE